MASMANGKMLADVGVEAFFKKKKPFKEEAFLIYLDLVHLQQYQYFNSVNHDLQSPSMSSSYMHGPGNRGGRRSISHITYAI